MRPDLVGLLVRQQFHAPLLIRAASGIEPSKTSTISSNQEKKGALVDVIPVFRPLIEAEELGAAKSALELGWLGMGSFTKEFEDAIKDICELDEFGGGSVVAVSTGHAALHLAMMLMDIGPGDEVITPSFNNAADFQAILACGATPVFVDIDETTLCIDVEKVEALISKRTKCIIAMDYDIMTCNHTVLANISDRTGIPVLHDAAHSFGSRHSAIPIGNQHQYTMFSFDPVKTITAIDGGALILRNQSQLERAQAMRLIGMTQPASQLYTNSRAWTYDVQELGFRYHLSNLHAAIGLSQLQKLHEIRQSRQAVCREYSEAFTDNPLFSVPDANFESVNPFLYYIRVLNGRRERFREHLSSLGVDTGIHWQPGHHFELFKDCPRGPLEVTERISDEIVSLPLHSKMRRDHVRRVIEAVQSFA